MEFPHDNHRLDCSRPGVRFHREQAGQPPRLVIRPFNQYLGTQKEQHMNDPSSSDAMETQMKTAANEAADAVTCASEQVRKLGAQAAEVGEQVYRQAIDAGRYASRQVEEQPWTAVIATGLLALGIGILLGRGSVPRPRTARDYVDGYLPRNLRRG